MPDISQDFLFSRIYKRNKREKSGFHLKRFRVCKINFLFRSGSRASSGCHSSSHTHTRTHTTTPFRKTCELPGISFSPGKGIHVRAVRCYSHGVHVYGENCTFSRDYTSITVPAFPSTNLIAYQHPTGFLPGALPSFHVWENFTSPVCHDRRDIVAFLSRIRSATFHPAKANVNCCPPNAVQIKSSDL